MTFISYNNICSFMFVVVILYLRESFNLGFSWYHMRSYRRIFYIRINSWAGILLCIIGMKSSAWSQRKVIWFSESSQIASSQSGICLFFVWSIWWHTLYHTAEKFRARLSASNLQKRLILDWLNCITQQALSANYCGARICNFYKINRFYLRLFRSFFMRC